MEPITMISIPYSEESEMPSKHTVFIVTVKGQSRSWVATHRFSEFEQLHKALSIPAQLSINLPKKSMYLSEKGLVERRLALESYLLLILYCKDKSFRSTTVWLDFLVVPESDRCQELCKNPSISQFWKSADEKGLLSSQNWMYELEALQNSIRDLKQTIFKKNQAFVVGNQGLYQSLRLDVIREIRILSLRFDALERCKKDLSNISKTESNRRDTIAFSMKSEISGLGSQIQESVITDNRLQLLEPQSSNGGSKRKFGVKAQETEVTRPLDNQQLLVVHQKIIRKQDQELEMLASVVRRQKEIGMAISDEVEFQNGLLEEVDESISRTAVNMKIAERKLKKLN